MYQFNVIRGPSVRVYSHAYTIFDLNILIGGSQIKNVVLQYDYINGSLHPIVQTLMNR